MPKFPIRHLSQMPVLSDIYPNFSFSQPPPASVNFRGLPSPHVLCNLDNALYGRGGRKPNPQAQYLARIAFFSADYANIRFRLRPRSSVSACLA